MAHLGQGSVCGSFTHNGQTFELRDTEEFEIETFGWLANQEFPTDHYEYKPFQVNGGIGTGKTTLCTAYYGYRVSQIWNNLVGKFFIEDLYAAIDAVKVSPYRVNYLILDDAVSRMDSRKSMENADMTEMYYEIRHELHKHSIQSGGNAGGLVITALLTQDYMAIDKRLRNGCVFKVFKGYDPYCEKLIKDKEMLDLLIDMKDESQRKCNYKYRALAVGVDGEKNHTHYTLFKNEVNLLPKVNLKTNLNELTEQKPNELDFFYITARNRKEVQKQDFIDYLLTIPNIIDLQRGSLRAEIYEKMSDMTLNNERVLISKNDFTEIIDRARRSRERELENTKNLKSKTSPERTKYPEYILKQCFGKSFDEIAEIRQIAKSTAHARYIKQRELIKKDFDLLAES